MPPKPTVPSISTDFLVPDLGRMQTRAENKGKVVGKPLMTKKRATKAEMAARREAETRVKAAKNDAHLQAVEKVAAIEDAQQKMDEDNEANANHPKSKKITRVPRPMPKSLVTETDPFIATDDEDERMVLDQPEPISQKTKEKPKSKKEKGSAARSTVEAMRTVSTDSPLSITDSGKRKADIHTSPKKQTTKKNKAPRSAPVGLIKNWDSQTPSNPSLRTKASLGTFPSETSLSTPGVDDSSDFFFANGGISDNEEHVQHTPSNLIKVEPRGKHMLIAQIKPPTDSRADPMTTPTPASKSLKGRKPKATMHDLPLGTSAKFATSFILLVKAYVGIIPAWADPEIPVFRRHWRTVYGQDMNSGWEKDNTVPVLIGYRLESWHNGFAQHAIQAVKSMLTAFATKEECAQFIANCLGTNPKDRRFYWKKRADGKKLLFQSDIIMYTLSSHYKDIKNATSHMLALKPIGALILSIQAVVRALGFYSTGEEVMSTSKLSHFSRENYGDRQVLSETRTVKTEKRSSALLPSVQQLTKLQWEAIIAAAKAFANGNKASKSGVKVEDDDADESDDFVLCESDSDVEDSNEVGFAANKKDPAANEPDAAADESDATTADEDAVLEVFQTDPAADDAVERAEDLADDDPAEGAEDPAVDDAAERAEDPDAEDEEY